MSINLKQNVGGNRKLKCVVRVATSLYKTKRGIAQTKTMSLLRRKSQLDISDFIDDLSTQCIEGFDTAEDGVYELVTFDHSYDWGSGVCDDWEVGLIPFKEEDTE